jgi:hypothetical protein
VRWYFQISPLHSETITSSFGPHNICLKDFLIVPFACGCSKWTLFRRIPLQNFVSTPNPFRPRKMPIYFNLPNVIMLKTLLDRGFLVVKYVKLLHNSTFLEVQLLSRELTFLQALKTVFYCLACSCKCLRFIHHHFGTA